MNKTNEGRSNKIRVTKTRCIITRMKRNMKANPVLVEDYLGKDMSKANRPQADKKLHELTFCFALLKHCDHLNDLEMEGKVILPKKYNPPKHTMTDHLGKIK